MVKTRFTEDYLRKIHPESEAAREYAERIIERFVNLVLEVKNNEEFCKGFEKLDTNMDMTDAILSCWLELLLKDYDKRESKLIERLLPCIYAELKALE